MYDDQNIFARILRGEIPAAKRFENAHALAFDDIAAKAPVHVLVIPKGAYKTFNAFLSGAKPAEFAAFGEAVAAILRETGLEEGGYRIVSNNGADGGQEVPHFHVHILGGGKLGRPFAPA